MKTFKDLKFEPLDLLVNVSNGDSIQHKAHLFFDNGYGISVISGFGTYTNDKCPYEIAVLKGDERIHELCYDSGITDDVIGYCSEQYVTKIMGKIQNLNKIN